MGEKGKGGEWTSARGLGSTVECGKDEVGGNGGGVGGGGRVLGLASAEVVASRDIVCCAVVCAVLSPSLKVCYECLLHACQSCVSCESELSTRRVIQSHHGHHRFGRGHVGETQSRTKRTKRSAHRRHRGGTRHHRRRRKRRRRRIRRRRRRPLLTVRARRIILCHRCQVRLWIVLICTEDAIACGVLPCRS